MQLFPSLSACFAKTNPDGSIKGGCGWAELQPLVDALLKNIMILGLCIAVIMIMYAGYILVNKQGSAEARTQVRKIFVGIVIGMTLLVGAYYIVEFILDTLGVSAEYRQGSLIKRN